MLIHGKNVKWHMEQLLPSARKQTYNIKTACRVFVIYTLFIGRLNCYLDSQWLTENTTKRKCLIWTFLAFVIQCDLKDIFSWFRVLNRVGRLIKKMLPRWVIYISFNLIFRNTCFILYIVYCVLLCDYWGCWMLSREFLLQCNSMAYQLSYKNCLICQTLEK